MGRASTGAKSGLVAGLVWGIISAIFTAVALIALKQDIINALNSYISGNSAAQQVGLTANDLYNTVLVIGPVADIIVGLIVGMILGAIYGWGVNKIPGENYKVKGVVFGIILWLISAAFSAQSVGEYGILYTVFNLAGAFVGAIVYGYLLGTFYEKWSKEPVQSQTQVSQ